MARKRVDTAPQFNVGDDSVVIQQTEGSTAPLLDIKDHTGSSLMTVGSTGAMTTSAPMTSPSMSGTPTAPTAAAGTNTTQIATTEFVTTADNLKANLASPTFTGTPLAPTAAAATNTTQIATTAFVRTEVSNLVASAPAALDTLDELAAALGDDANFATTVTNSLALKAPLDSPTFTGTPTAPTVSIELSNTQLATTEFVKQIAALFTPSGSVISYAGSSAPTGWLLCSGQTVSRTEYSALFAAIGTTYGAGDGSTTFALPDMRGRTVAGVDDMGGFAASRLTSANSGITGTSLGAAGGTEAVTLTSSQSGIPAHSHANTASFAGNSHNHTQNSHNHTQNSHSHLLRFPGSIGANRYIISDWGDSGSGGSYYTQLNSHTINTTLPGSYAVAEGATATNQASTATNQAATAGGTVTMNNVANTTANASEAHTNTQPTIVLNYIIKA